MSDDLVNKIAAGEVVRLGAGESITLRPYCYHAFWAEGAPVLFLLSRGGSAFYVALRGEGHGEVGGHAVAVQEEHDVAHLALFLPGLGDQAHAFGADVGHLAQPLGRGEGFEFENAVVGGTVDEGPPWAGASRSAAT